MHNLSPGFGRAHLGGAFASCEDASPSDKECVKAHARRPSDPYGYGMTRSWSEIEREIVRYESHAHRPAIVAFGSILVMLIVGLTTENILAGLLPLLIGMTVAIVLSSDGITCPACRATVQHGTHGNPGAIMVLKNLRQCPYCQHRFDEP